jgi:GH15 family glucan-1,4-alpha-glucosidase
MISVETGNGRILLTINDRGTWSELYHPHPGQHQQLLRGRLGLFDAADGRFLWLDESPGPVSQTYVADSSIPRTRLQALDLDVTLDDVVHPTMSLIVRQIRIRNPHDTPRRLRVFQYQAFNLGGSLYQDTAYWDQERRLLVHYKGQHYAGVCGFPNFDAVTCGEHTIRGLQGSFVDAEDGNLHGSAISHGAADSVAQWNLDLEPGAERSLYLLVLLEGTRQRLHELHRQVAGKDPQLFVQETLGFSNHWVQAHGHPVEPGLSRRVHDIYRRSLFVLRDCQSLDGSIIASPDSRTLKVRGDTYTYCWWRDGAYAAFAMSESRMHRNAQAFLSFAARCQEPEGYFVHRHLPDGTVGSSWHPPPFLQLDQAASVVNAVWRDYEESGNIDDLLAHWPMVRAAADFIMGFVDERGLPRPSFDIWEERKAINTYTVASAICALRSGASIGRTLARRSQYWADAANRMQEAALTHLWNPSRNTFHKSIDPVDETVDASTLLALLNGILPPSDPRYALVVQAVEQRLWRPDTGGVARFENDTYYGRENPWIICALWLAQVHLSLGNAERCREIIEWVATTATPTNLLAEQLEAPTGRPTSVWPLVWSHSTFLETVNAYTKAKTSVAQVPLVAAIPSVR